MYMQHAKKSARPQGIFFKVVCWRPRDWNRCPHHGLLHSSDGTASSTAKSQECELATDDLLLTIMSMVPFGVVRSTLFHQSYLSYENLSFDQVAPTCVGHRLEEAEKQSPAWDLLSGQAAGVVSFINTISMKTCKSKLAACSSHCPSSHCGSRDAG